MLAEAFAWLFTPASTLARRTGHLSESIAIMARERRCRTAWAPHLEASRAALLESARRASSRRVALVLGSGPLLDVPLAELSGSFEEVWLVDMVHPLRARLQARGYGNVRLIEHDVTEGLAGRYPAGMRPARFQDEARVDWVASVNLLSQLPGPAQSGTAMRADAAMTAHLEYLARFRASVCLLADLEQVMLDGDGAVAEAVDFRPLLSGWRLLSEWRWDVAPPGELGGGRSRYHRVAALVPAE
jgi:hypothetical protein